VATKKVAQDILQEILQKRSAISAAEAELETLESQVFDALQSGASIAPGLFTAEIKISERRTTAWRQRAEEFVDEIRGKGEGVKWSERVVAATKPSATEKLVVKISA